jgi:hypothetical protein
MCIQRTPCASASVHAKSILITKFFADVGVQNHGQVVHCLLWLLHNPPGATFMTTRWMYVQSLPRNTLAKNTASYLPDSLTERHKPEVLMHRLHVHWLCGRQREQRSHVLRHVCAY